MKKILFALLAVVTLASCGSKDPVSAIVSVFEKAKATVVDAKSADDVIAVLETLKADLNSVKEEYKDVLETLQLNSKMEEAVSKVAEGFGEAIADKLIDLKPTAEQATKILDLLQSIE